MPTCSATGSASTATPSTGFPTLNVSINNTRGPDVLAATPGIAAATGSACHEGDHEPSPVLSAMGQLPERALAALRFSLGRWTTAIEIDQAAQQIAAGVARLART